MSSVVNTTRNGSVSCLMQCLTTPLLQILTEIQNCYTFFSAKISTFIFNCIIKQQKVTCSYVGSFASAKISAV